MPKNMEVKIKNKYSFINAYNSLSEGKKRLLKNEIMVKLGISRSKWFCLKRGYSKDEDPANRRISELSVIQSIFAKYGIEDCWDED